MPPAPKKRPPPELDATNEAPHTPSGSPTKKKLNITQKQKEALIQNLQLEITERARNLRAHYGLQVQDLRSRLERRVNRIPIVMRKQTMGELLAKHEENAKQASAKKPATKTTKKTVATKPRSAPASPRKEAPAVSRPVKRKSDEIHSSDKENAPFVDDGHPPLANPKKRTKPNLAGSSRAVSNLAVSELSESRVLSPKSSNSRTFPQSPLKSPSKIQHEQFMSSRPSPLKLTSPLKTRSGATTASRKTMAQENVAPAGKTTTGTARKPPSRPPTRGHNRENSNSTVMSNASNGTTIVRPSKATGAKKTTKTTTTTGTTTKKAAAPRTQASTAASAAKKAGAAARKTQAVDQPAPGRRVLRNRG